LVFSLQGYQVLGLSDGASLLAAARQRIPACIILDVHMPGRSGLDILKELNADDYAAPILIISGQGDIAMAVDSIKNGALDFIEKPFDAQGVLSIKVDDPACHEGAFASGSQWFAPYRRLHSADRLATELRDVGLAIRSQRAVKKKDPRKPMLMQIRAGLRTN
jgi:ActR/RegA family two-component response regulator